MSSSDAPPWAEAPDVLNRARKLFERLDLGSVRSTQAMLDRVIAVSGKPLEVTQIDDPALAKTTALWVEYDDRSKILLRASDRPYYQVRGLHHEFGHMLFGHPGCTGLASDPELTKYTAGGGKVRGRVLISPQDVSTPGGDQSEAEAEVLGAMITRALLRPIYADDERLFG